MSRVLLRPAGRAARATAAVVLLLAACAAEAVAQAPTSLELARARYEAQKNSGRAIAGAVSAQLVEIDARLDEAARLGRTGEMRRLLARATALLGGREWTPLDDFNQSLVLRTDQLFIDANHPYRARLEQIYAPDLELTTPLTVRASVRPLLSQPAGVPEVHEVGGFTGVSRDLRESPLTMELDLAAVFSGPHVLEIEVSDDKRQLARIATRVWVQKGLDDRVRALESAARTLAPAVRPSVLYPIDFMAKVNRGAVEMGAFDVARELMAAEAVVSAASRTPDPFATRRGDLKRHYLLQPAGEIMPYRVYVPRAYDAARTVPLVIALHGPNATEDSLFDGFGKRLTQLAEQHGFIVASPLGYRPDAGFGAPAGGRVDPLAERTRALSEQDVMEVVRRMRQDYNVDEDRIFLLGHSTGARGAWHLAAKSPEMWAGVAAFSGTIEPGSAARMKQVPQFVVQGDADPVAPVAATRGAIAEMKKLGMTVTYVEVPGGRHVDIVEPHLAAAFEFFGKQGRSPEL